ncbi:MAG: ABC transporter permease subunit, partial [Dehalococcoidia bacterium]
MLRSILLKTLRDQRWPVFAWGGGIAIYVIVNAFGWARAYPDEASRQLIAQQIASGLSATQLLYGEPHNIDQLGGYLGWRAFGVIPVLIGIFIVIAATGATRGAEERGETAVVLSAGQGRGAMFLQQAAGLLLALAAICVLIWLSLLPAGQLADEAALNLGRVTFEVLNAGVAAALFGGFALLVAQFARTRRAAALVAGIVMFAAYIWNNLGLIAS